MTANDVIVGDKRLCATCGYNLADGDAETCVECRHRTLLDCLRWMTATELDDPIWAGLFVKVAKRLGHIPENLKPQLAHAMRTANALMH
jgi:hypothetical protein